jgi:hypothetical protein
MAVGSDDQWTGLDIPGKYFLFLFLKSNQIFFSFKDHCGPDPANNDDDADGTINQVVSFFSINYNLVLTLF